MSQGIEGIPASNTALFDLLQDHGMALPTPDGKAIWKAAITGDNGWPHTFTLLKLSPALIWEASKERQAPFAGTVEVVAGEESESEEASAVVPDSPVPAPVAEVPATAIPALFSKGSDVDRLLEMFDPPSEKEMPKEARLREMIEATPDVNTEPAHTPFLPNLPQDPSGEHFIAWLRQRITSRILIINDAKALVHTVADTVYLVSPGIFQRYAQEYPATAIPVKQEGVGDWQWIQKRFEKLSLHRKQPDGLNLWHCQVAGPRKTHRLHGYLLKDPKCLFDDTPPNNPHLAVVQAGQDLAKAKVEMLSK